MRKFAFLIVLASFVAVASFTTSAEDFTLEESRSLAVVPKNGVRRALLIATGRHMRKTIAPLSGVDPDVDLLRERLLDPRCGFLEENVSVLKSDDFPSLETISEAIDAFLDSCGPNDFAFLYLAGHGVRNPETKVDYYVPFDAKPIIENGRVVAFVGSSCYSLQTLKEKIASCDAKFKWVIVDACRENLDARGDGEPWNSIGKLEAAKGSLWFQSCNPGRCSFEIWVDSRGKQVKHGMFTWFFCQGAEGAAANGDGLITPLGLLKYVQTKIKKARENDRTIPEQEPLFSCQDLSDASFVFVDDSLANPIRARKAHEESSQLFLKRDYSRALDKINEALEIQPEDEEFKDLKKAIVVSIVQELVTQGWGKYAEKKYSEALSCAESALKLDPTNAAALALKEQAENPPTKLPIDYTDLNEKEYRLIQAGSFTMGSPLTGEEVVKKYPTSLEAKYFDDAPQHKVTLTQDFYLAKRPVTRGEFRQFVEATKYKTTAEKEGSAYTLTKDDDWKEVDGKNWRDPGFTQTDDHPVVCISYDDALAYVAWLNKNAKSSPELNGRKPIYRLPTEAEWEYACRAGTQTEFFWGDEEKDGKGYLNVAGTEDAPSGKKWDVHFSFDDGYSATSPVGVFKPNPWGLYDMLGNVWEWTSDWYGDYPKGSATDPKGAESGSSRVLRGGSWDYFPGSCRCAFRSLGVPALRRAIIGVRVAFSLAKE